MTMTQKDFTTLLVSDIVWERHGEAIRALGPKISPVIYEGNDVLPDEVIETLDAVFYSSDLWPERSRGIVLSILKAKNIMFLQVCTSLDLLMLSVKPPRNLSKTISSSFRIFYSCVFVPIRIVKLFYIVAKYGIKYNIIRKVKLCK
jgi:hypothetical protein